MNKFEIRRLNLKHIIDEKFSGKVADCARKIDKDYSYVKRLLYEEGKKGKKRIGDDMVEVILNTFSYPPGWLDIPHWNKSINENANHYYSTNIENIEIRRVPLINWIQAGAWTTIEENSYPENPDNWITAPSKVSRNAYALRIVGDSMLNPYGTKSIPHGSIVIVEPNQQAKNGDIVIARLDDSSEATIKQLVIDGNQRYLKPLNPQYPIIQINGNCTICGVAIKQVSDL